MIIVRQEKDNYIGVIDLCDCRRAFSFEMGWIMASSALRDKMKPYCSCINVGRALNFVSKMG